VKLSELPPKTLAHLLGKSGLKLKIGLFHTRLSSSISRVAEHLRLFYGGFDLLDNDEFIDFSLKISAPSLIRRFFRPQVNFSFDGHLPFKPLPYDQAAAFFEWGLNWCIASHAHPYLIIHAAVVERNGCGLLLPGSPGSGKSTLCAALVGRGWRLLSDEMALVSLADGLVYPVPRPISLKNESLAVIRAFCPDLVLGPVVKDTSKGTVSHVRPPDASIDLAKVPVKIRHVIFPKYVAGAATELTALSKGRGFMALADNSFNYAILGARGFDAVGDLCDAVEGHDFRYSQLEEAVALFSGLCP